MENDKSAHRVFLERLIEATYGMGPKEYMEFMELSGPERIKRVEEILESRDKGDEDGKIYFKT